MHHFHISKDNLKLESQENKTFFFFLKVKRTKLLITEIKMILYELKLIIKNQEFD